MDKIHEFPPIIKWKFGLDFGGHYKAIKSEKTIAQIAAFYKVFPARIHQWRKQLLQGCEQVFVDENPQNKIIAKKLLEKDFQIEDLQKKVGELTMANDFYKKKFPS